MYKATWKVDENDEGSIRLCKHLLIITNIIMERNLNTVIINCGAQSTKNFFVYSKLMLVFSAICGCYVRDFCIRFIFSVQGIKP
jgi:hypothetical protein